jgi:hypothetical protein
VRALVLFLLGFQLQAYQTVEECLKDNPKISTYLDKSCLYKDIAKGIIFDGVKKYEPKYILWTDGAKKRRFIYIPKGTKIDNTNPNSWKFPRGTVIWKEFIKDGLMVETRVLRKTGSQNNIMAWKWATYVWNKEQNNGKRVYKGAENVLGTTHDIPREHSCFACHSGHKDMVLGFDHVQLGLKQEDPNLLNLEQMNELDLFTHATSPTYTIPGDEAFEKAQGYLHANCSHCHNADHHAGVRVGLFVKVDVTKDAHEQEVMATAVGKPTQVFNAKKWIVKPGDPKESALFHRLNSNQFRVRMAPIGRETIDKEGVEIIRKWIESLKKD